MSIWTRRARLRNLQEGMVQKARAESLEHQAHDDAERFLDYGFAAHPVDGQGLVMHVDGHTVVLRMDRLAERPRLAAYEVCVWHKEGHSITLKAGGVIEINGKSLVLNVDGAVAINSAALTHNGVNISSSHVHGGIAPGPANTSGPQ